jgi:hypothetical protein
MYCARRQQFHPIGTGKKRRPSESVDEKIMEKFFKNIYWKKNRGLIRADACKRAATGSLRYVVPDLLLFSFLPSSRPEVNGAFTGTLEQW